MYIRFPVTLAGIFIFCLIASGAKATTCATVAACAFYRNIATGVGIEGTSAKNFGVYGLSTSSHGIDGQSKSSFGTVGITYANGRHASTARAGVFGEDLGIGDYNVGVAGMSVHGIGTQGLSTDSYGIHGASKNSVGVFGESKNNTAVLGIETSDKSGAGIGGYFMAEDDQEGVNGNTTGVIGDGDIGGLFFGTDTGGGIYVQSYGTGIEINGGRSVASGPSIQMVTNGSQFISAVSALNGNEVVSFDGSGNESIAGSLSQNGTAIARTHSNTGADLASYDARSASPTIEDFGSGVLRDGVANVPLDRTFMSTIAPGYMVFVTPHGDSNSLFTQNGPSGFVVHESKGGRSTLTFDYRIVARPIDARGSHLALMSGVPHQLRTKVRILARPKLPAVALRKLGSPVFR